MLWIPSDSLSTHVHQLGDVGPLLGDKAGQLIVDQQPHRCCQQTQSLKKIFHKELKTTGHHVACAKMVCMPCKMLINIRINSEIVKHRLFCFSNGTSLITAK